MSKQFERHAKSKWEWGTPPSRSAERSQAAAEDVRDPAKKAPARKDTRAWCRGKVGVGHVPVLALDTSLCRQAPECGWRVGWSSEARDEVAYWGCPHHEICGTCGKVLRDRWTVPAAECPAYPGSREQRAKAEVKLAEARERRAKWEQQRQLRRKPPITGPQGFRRRRARAPQ